MYAIIIHQINITEKEMQCTANFSTIPVSAVYRDHFPQARFTTLQDFYRTLQKMNHKSGEIWSSACQILNWII